MVDSAFPFDRKHGPDTAAFRVSVWQDKTVWTKSVRGGRDKRQATLVLTAFASGITFVKPDIYFEGTANSTLEDANMEGSARTATHMLASISLRRVLQRGNHG